MFKISCFADEISPDFEEQLSVAKEAGLGYVELRSAWDANILDLGPKELDRMRSLLREYGFKVSCIGSPIGKAFIEDPFEAHLDEFRHGLDLARFFGCSYIRVFSFYSKGDIHLHREEVVERLRIMLGLAEQAKIKMVHENEKGIYGHTSSQCLDLAQALDSPWFALVLDPANYCLAGERPYDESLKTLGKHVDYVHIKDYCAASKRMVLAGTGDGQFDRILPALRGRDIFLTLEPHLEIAGQFGGFTGKAKFKEACKSLVALLRANDLDFE